MEMMEAKIKVVSKRKRVVSSVKCCRKVRKIAKPHGGGHWL